MPQPTAQPFAQPTTPKLPDGVEQGTYAFKSVAAGNVEVEIREFIGWWRTDQAGFTRAIKDARPDKVTSGMNGGD